AAGVHATAPPTPSPPTRPLLAGCGRIHLASTTAVPLASPGAGSTVALATRDGRTLAYTADEDDAAIHVVDVDARKELGETALEGRPSQLLFLPDGRLAVLLRDRSQIAVLEPGSKPEELEKRCTVATPTEPVALALTPDRGTLLVTSGWGRALTAFDAAKVTRSFEVSLPREPRAVVVSDDGRFAYVSHAVGAQASRVTLADKTVTAISLQERDPQVDSQVRALEKQIDDHRKKEQKVPSTLTDQIAELEKGTHPSCQGFALAKSLEPGGRILAPQVLVDNGDAKERAPGYGNDESATEVGDVAVIDAATGRPISASLERPTENGGWGNVDAREIQKTECLLPRAAAMDPASRSLLVSCYGIDQVIAYDSLAASPARAERRRWSVSAGPSGIAVDTPNNRAVVWAQFDRSLDVIDFGDGRLADDKGRPPAGASRIAMAPNAAHPLTVAASLGRLLFHSVGDGRIARDGRACASCHPEGRDDSLVWATPDGPRRTIMLAGRVKGTAPYAWNGTEDDLRVHLSTTFDRLNGAGGLKSVELQALTAYVESLAPPVAQAAAPDAQVQHGAELFASAEVGCASCHAGALGTDNLRHDVKSKTEADKAGEFNTPSLHLVGGTGPYFHDGRYKTLHDLLTATRDDMGHTSQLSPRDLEAIEAYLRTL
ncbi:MAG TPA: cytochrome C peroxidase, partial [Polyangiaceae bacterium]|nr:cytochrome C peroxidase [Polyangiaceae bacterium]